MAKKKTRLEALEERLPAGWHVATNSPGGVPTRYKFYQGKPTSYFGASGETVNGISEAEQFVEDLLSAPQREAAAVAERKAMVARAVAHGGVAPRHGLVSKPTMADLKRLNEQAGGFYFSSGAKKFFGGDKFYGPYVGPGGVFFVAHNKAGWTINEFETDHGIKSIPHTREHGEDVRAMAQEFAKGTIRSR